MDRVDHEAFKSAIEAVADENGVITPERVVEAARDPKNILHAQFEWNDRIAAHEHRLATARALIRSIRYVAYDVPTAPPRAIQYAHTPGPAQGYIALSKAARDKELALRIMNEEVARCEAAVTRARDVAGTLGLSVELEALLGRIIHIQTILRAAE